MNKIVLFSAALMIIVGFGIACLALEPCEEFFKSVSPKLSKRDKQQICKKLGFTYSKNKKFVDETCGDVSPEIEVVDLNGDGVMEVFVNYGNTCTSGNTGRSISLFIKDKAGLYSENLGFPAIDYTRLPTKKKDYPDLMFGGPGFCHGVWRWSGVKYEYKCSIEEEPGACNRKGVKKVCK